MDTTFVLHYLSARPGFAILGSAILLLIGGVLLAFGAGVLGPGSGPTLDIGGMRWSSPIAGMRWDPSGLV